MRVDGKQVHRYKYPSCESDAPVMSVYADSYAMLAKLNEQDSRRRNNKLQYADSLYVCRLGLF